VSATSPKRSWKAPSASCGLLVDHREDYVAERTRIENRLLWDVHELAPGHVVAARSLGRRSTLDPLHALLEGEPGLVAGIARERLGRIRELTTRINELEREIARRTAELAPSLLASRAAAPSPPPSWSAKRPGPAGFALGPPTPGPTAPPLSRSPQGATTGTGSTAASSTAPCIGSRSLDATKRQGTCLHRAPTQHGRHQDRGDPSTTTKDLRRGLPPTPG